MKTLILTASSILISLMSFAQAKKINNPNQAQITFETDLIDYGIIEYNANGIREFKLTNTGTAPLIITSITGSCGCTIPSKPPKEPILPGETHVIKVKYDTKRLGHFNKTVTVKSNATIPIKIISIKGKIVAQKTSPIKDNGNPISLEN